MTSIYVPERRIRIRNAILGVLALALSVGAVWMTWFFLHGGFESGTPVKAIFSFPGVGQQLPIGGDVKVRGVLVGRISGIELNDEGDAVVNMRLRRSDLPASSRAEIRSKTIFGQKWVELILPTDPLDDEVLAAGSTIPDDHTREPLELERSLQRGHDLLDAIPFRDLSITFNALAQSFSGQEDDAIEAIEKGLVALRAVNEKGDLLDLSLRQLREFSEFLDDNDETVLSFMESLDSANRALIGSAPEFRRSLRTVPHFLRSFTRFQERINPDLARLIENGADLAELVEPRTDDLVDLVLQLQPFTTVWNSGLKQPCAGEFESGLTCWQLYQVPGYNSRGLYGEGEAPNFNDPGDPSPSTSATADRSFERLLARRIDDRNPSDLAKLTWRAALAGNDGPGLP